jgi:hypothetical protein
MFTFTTYYIIFACTLAYSIICVLGWRMHKLVKNRRKFGGRQQEMVNEMNRQKNRNLLIQVNINLYYINFLTGRLFIVYNIIQKEMNKFKFCFILKHRLFTI